MRETVGVNIGLMQSKHKEKNYTQITLRMARNQTENQANFQGNRILSKWTRGQQQLEFKELGTIC